MIGFDHVSLSLGDFTLTDCSFQIPDGEYCVIMGPSGAGKTILLELIAGLHEPDSGTLTLNGQNAATLPPEMRQVSIVYQDYALFPHMTVGENICYGMRIQKFPKREQQKRCRELMEMFGISHLEHRRPLTLSGGEAQRTALARALAVRPNILLLDEPFSALDPQTRRQCITDMKQLHESGLTIVQVTHAQTEAELLATRLAIIRDGRLVQEGKASDVLRHPADAVTAAFLGYDNIIDGTVLGIPHMICIKSDDILLSLEKREGWLQGVILSGETNGPLTSYRIDIGVVLTAVLGKREGSFLAGSPVFVKISPETIHILRNPATE